jgi:thioredoxin-dependent peroxiredoxin
MGFPLLATMMALGTFGTTHAAEPPKTPKAGDTAPLVSGKTQEGKKGSLSDALGTKAVLLYFYPKDDTPGCTKQACGLRDRMEELKAANVEVIGVSFDSAESHKQFAEKHSLNFTLVADPDGKIADAYGVRLAPVQNRARRVSFLISREGKILHVTDTPDASIHLQEMKEAVAKLEK